MASGGPHRYLSASGYVALGFLCITIDELDPLLYRGGFAVVALLPTPSPPVISATPVVSQPKQPPASPTALATPQPRTAPVFFLGDSVMLSGWKEVKEILGNPEVDGEVSRQVLAAIDILRERVAAGQRDRVVIIHVGNNGVFTARQFDEIREQRPMPT